MGLRTLLRTGTTLVATTVVAALLTAPGASGYPCLDCDTPELPDDPGTTCPTIAASTDPWIQVPQSPAKPKVGSVVTGRTGVWNSNTKNLKVMWFVGDSAVGTATTHSNVDNRTFSYTVKAADLGKPVRLWVRGIGDAAPCVKDEFSGATANVEQGDPPVNLTAPTPGGPAQVGKVLTASPGTWSTPPESYSYEWYREGSTEAIGSGQSFTPAAADVGKRLRVGVTAQRAGHWVGFAYSTFTAVVAQGTFTHTTLPSVAGEHVFGESLSGNDGQWPSGTTVTRQWTRNGTPIAGATGSGYTLGLQDLGQTVAFVVTATRPGYESQTRTVSGSPVARAAAPVWTGKRLTLKGTDKVAKKVKVAVGARKIRTRAAAPGAKVTYQWLRNGKRIKGSTKSAHVIRKVDRSKKLKARITIARPGHKVLVIVTRAVRIRNNGKTIR